MATQLRLRRGNTAQTAVFTGALAEVTVDTDKKTLVVHDGVTAGGFPLAVPADTASGVLGYNRANNAFAQANLAYNKANSSNVLAQAAYDNSNTKFASSGGTISGDVSVTGNVNPTNDNTNYLGSSAKRWHTIYVGPGSVNIDGITLSNTNGKLEISGATDILFPGMPSTDGISDQANNAFAQANLSYDAANSAVTSGQANVGAGLISVTLSYEANVGAARISDVASGQANVGSGLIGVRNDYEANVGIVNINLSTETSNRQANVGAVNIALNTEIENRQANVGTAVISLTSGYQANAGMALINAKSYTDTANTDLKNYTDTLVNTANTNLKNYTDTLVNTANTDLKNYVDAADSSAATISQANVGAGLISVTNAYQANVGSGLITYQTTSEANVGASLIVSKAYTDGANANLKNYVDVANTNLKNYVDTNIVNGIEANVGAGIIATQANVGAGLIANALDSQANIGAGLISVTSAYQANVGAGLISLNTNLTSAYQANVGAGLISAKSTSEANVGAGIIDAKSFTQTAYNSSNTKFSSSGGLISGNVEITGNLIVSGNTTTVSANNLVVKDNMLYMNDGANVASADIGIAGSYVDGTYKHSGIFRDYSDGIWKVFDNYTPEPDASPNIDTSNTSFRIGNFTANVIADIITLRGIDPHDYANTLYSSMQANVGAARIADVASGQANVGAGLISVTSAYQANVGAGLISTKTTSEANVGAGLITKVAKAGDVMTGPLVTSSSFTGSSIVANTSVTVNTSAFIESTSVTTASTSQITLDSFTTSSYRSGKYLVQMTSGSSYHMIELSLIHDGTTVYLSQYGEVKTGTSLGTFDASITTGTLSLLFTPTNAITTAKAVSTLIPV